MTTPTSAVTTRRQSATTIVAPIGAVGAAAAVAGPATSGDSTDSTSPVGTTVDTGVVSIEPGEAGDSGTVPFAGESCPVSRARSGSDFTRAGTRAAYCDGPLVVGAHALAGAASLPRGATAHLLRTAALPGTATGDAFDGATSSLNVQFTGTQRTGSAR